MSLTQEWIAAWLFVWSVWMTSWTYRAWLRSQKHRREVRELREAYASPTDFVYLDREDVALRVHNVVAAGYNGDGSLKVSKDLYQATLLTAVLRLLDEDRVNNASLCWRLASRSSLTDEGKWIARGASECAQAVSRRRLFLLSVGGGA